MGESIFTSTYIHVHICEKNYNSNCNKTGFTLNMNLNGKYISFKIKKKMKSLRRQDDDIKYKSGSSTYFRYLRETTNYRTTCKQT